MFNGYTGILNSYMVIHIYTYIYILADHRPCDAAIRARTWCSHVMLI